MRFVSLSRQGFDDVHRENREYLSVTNFITFMGHGYKSRRDLFRESKPNDFAERAMNHGNKWEQTCFALFKKHFSDRYECWTYENELSIYDEKYRLLGTVDGYVIDKETGEIGILEIKCPFGVNQGRWDESTIPRNFEQKDSYHKHWIQIQLYLFLHRELNFSFGILIYFYPFSGEGGEHMIDINRIRPHKGIEEMVGLEKWMNIFLYSYDNTKRYKRQDLPRLKEIISKGVESRQRVLLPAK